MFEVRRYKRTAYNFEVDAVRIDLGNLWQVAAWTGGEVCVTQDQSRRKYVRVYTTDKKSPIRKAYAGDWVVKLDHGAKKVYNHDAFHKSFDLVEPPVELMDAYRGGKPKEE